MRTQPVRFLLAAAAATALSATLAAQDAIRVLDTGALVRADGVSAAVSRDGGSTWTALPTPNYQLNWRDRSFDPMTGDPSIASSLMSGESNQLFYVQFVTDIIPEYAVAMEQLGAVSTRYYPNQALIARIPRERTDVVGQQPYVRAVMELEAGHKLDEEIQRGLLANSLQTASYNILLVDKEQGAGELEARIVEIGGVLESPAGGGILLQASLTPEQLMTVARENTVLWMDPWSAPEYDIDKLRVEAGVDYVESVTGIDGKGMRGHINEGVYSHGEFAAQAPYRTGKLTLMGTGGSGHGTNTAGEIYAMGLPGGIKGIIPYAQLTHSPSVGGSRYSMVQQLVDPAGPYMAMMMTQSWGGSRTTSYNSTSALLDDILFDFDHMFATNSQSNAGSRPSRPEAWAKNVCGIGGYNHYNTTTPADDCWCFTGSIGPAQDGRVGVSFAAYYDNIRTTSGTSGYTNTFGGTSGATPIVNGLSGVAIQMFTDGLLGYPGVAWDERFDAIPNLTTTRVLLSMGTRQLGFSQATRVQQGWGLPNMRDIYDNRDNILLLDEEDVLKQGQATNYWVWVKPGTSEFRASMHHLEDEAVPSAIPTRINSLDLTVLGPTGSFYRGNGNGILTGQWSSTGGSANDVDIHENVFIQNPPAGMYRVRVEATAVRADSHKETPQVDADFALAIRGIGGGRDTSGMLVDLDGSTPGQLLVSASNVPASGWTHGFTIFSRDTTRHISLGNYFGVKPDGLLEWSLAKPSAAGNVISFTNSSNPADYPNATYSFPAGVVSNNQGVTLDATVVLMDAAGNVVEVSNVSRATVQ